MNRSIRIITAVVIAAAGIYYGLRLAVAADKDDSPGGVYIGVVIMFLATGFGLWLGLRERANGAASAGR
jgi:hypothetical protein